jgi:DNA-binding NarL/FixJ family response regulator
MAALNAGASAYVLKSQSPSDLTRAIHKVLEGGICRPRRHIEKPVDHTSIRLRAMLREPLTEREREVLRLFAEGHTSKEIAGRLKISAKTAEFHKYRIMQKLKLRSVAEMTKYAIKHGLVSL